MTPEEIHRYIDNEMDARMERIIELAVQKVFDRMYEEIGKGVVEKALYIIGIGALTLLCWFAGKGFFKAG